MNILIIGNGFDLAHKLPTGYLDFLQFVHHVYWFEQDNNIKENMTPHKSSFINYAKDFHDNIFNELQEIFCVEINRVYKKRIKIKSDVFNLIEDNAWVNFFLKRKDQAKSKGWIDFEFEISTVIKRLDKDYNSILLNKDTIVCLDDFRYCEDTDFSEYNKRFDLKTMNELIVRLEKDLKRFVELLELYLKEFVGKIELYNQSTEIMKLKIDKVLSFNYTTTYENSYPKCDMDYIHGKIGNSNIILGIDEYLDDDNKNINLHFIKFKKYFQRIHKKTGCEYKKWLETDVLKKIYIFGHSMDVSDKDILRDFLEHKTAVVTIYYHNDEAYEKLIVNIVKLIGQDKLIEKVYGEKPTIIFKQQANMEQPGM